MAGRDGLVVRFWLQGPRVPGSRPHSTEDQPCMLARCTLIHIPRVKHPPAGVVWNFREGVPAQVPSSLSDLCSKLQDQCRNSHLVLRNGTFIKLKLEDG
ncbi:hypothetical protein AVEN_168495-1 [Araneus ventricosus]|uniref:Uncharacterized protein n=1 Tax=Araneus ventricosus TaxID=182803 RepID=A0A4Y2K0Y4_ARAVE|nr:hypothetical protein AVEN_168495-1 [Araneus ventricosus]